MLIAERFARVLGGDDAANLFLYAFARHVLAVVPFEPALEKELELEQPLRRMHVLIGRGPAHRGFVHVNVFGHVAQHHRLQLAHAMIEKVMLKLEDALGDPKSVCWRCWMLLISQVAARTFSCKY
jgi:hypothetical protein